MNPEIYPHHWANRFAFLLRKRLAERFARAGLDVTAEEWAVLLTLQARDRPTATQLSDLSFRDKTTVTRMVDRLAGKGLVVREPDRTDRRVQRLRLTGAGEEMFAALWREAQAIVAETTADLPQQVIETTVRTLAHMTRVLARMPRKEPQK